VEFAGLLLTVLANWTDASCFAAQTNWTAGPTHTRRPAGPQAQQLRV